MYEMHWHTCACTLHSKCLRLEQVKLVATLVRVRSCGEIAALDRGMCVRTTASYKTAIPTE